MLHTVTYAEETKYTQQINKNKFANSKKFYETKMPDFVETAYLFNWKSRNFKFIKCV